MIIVVSALSGPPSASICSSLGARASHRWRHVCTVPRLRRIWRVTWHWLAPVSSAKRILARRTSRWGLVCRRAICSKQARCRGVSCTLGETVGAGAMAVGIRNSFRESWALFSSYDTIPPSVRILLPSTTRSIPYLRAIDHRHVYHLPHALGGGGTGIMGFAFAEKRSYDSVAKQEETRDHGLLDQTHTSFQVDIAIDRPQ